MGCTEEKTKRSPLLLRLSGFFFGFFKGRTAGGLWEWGYFAFAFLFTLKEKKVKLSVTEIQSCGF